MTHTSIHYFDKSGNEVEEGSESSVVQYDEATAEKLGYKFKASDEKDPVLQSRDELMRIASLDGTEAPAKESKALSSDDVEPEPAPKKRAAKK